MPDTPIVTAVNEAEAKVTAEGASLISHNTGWFRAHWPWLVAVVVAAVVGFILRGH